MENSTISEEAPVSLTDEDFALLLEDRTFVDYFNVFNSLPIFGQHVIYNFIEKEFEYEPPIRKSKRYVDRREVVSWLVKQRYPLFEESCLFNEFVLCSKIRDADFNPESHHLKDTTGEQAMARYIFGRNILGCCLGMQLFREFLRGTAGEKVYRCWLDIEKWRHLPEKDERKALMVHQIKCLYLNNGAASELATKGKHIVFQGVLNFELVPEQDMHEELLAAIAEGDALYSLETVEAYVQLQRILLTSLRRYWVPRYLIHLLSYLPKDVLVILKRECPGDVGLLTQQRKRRFRITFPRIYSAQRSSTSTPYPASAVAAHSVPYSSQPTSSSTATATESSTETESDVSLPRPDSPQGESNNKDNVIEANIQPEDLLSLWGGQKLNKTETISQESAEALNERTDSDTHGLKELESWENSSESNASDFDADSKPPLMIPLPVMSYLRGRQRMNSGRFPTVTNKILCALASEHLASSPFRKFLKKNGLHLDERYVNFWTDVRHYLDTDDTYLDCFGNQMKKTLANTITQRYLVSCPPEEEIFSEGLKMTLFSCLTANDDVSLLCSAQDIVTGVLKEPWKDYMKEERKHFRLQVCKKRKIDRNIIELPVTQPSTKDGTDPLIFFNTDITPEGSCSRPQSGATSTDSSLWSQTTDMDHICLTEEQMWRAFEITVLCVEFGRTGMIPSSQPVIYDLIDVLYSDYGSLHIRRSTVVRQEFLRSLVHKPKIDIQNLRVSRKVLLDRAGMMSEKQDRPRYNRLVVRRDGILIERPARPKTFMEVLSNPSHYDFFKRYMMANKMIYPLLFWSAVEELKEAQTQRGRQNIVMQIYRRFFSKSAKQGYLLDCSDDIIRQIPTMEKVPASVMICAQGSVFRSMERKWFSKYLETYPTDAEYHESMCDSFPPDGMKIPQFNADKSQKPRRFKRRKTMHLWHGFAYSILDFLNAMKDSYEMRLFEIYMKCETDRESATVGLERSVVASSTMANFQTRIVLRNKLVIVNKLTCDLNFWTEVEKYKQQVENIQRLENISKSDTDLLFLKAKAIIDCYLSSEVPPRVQINVPTEIAVGISSSLLSSGPQRGLFHEACIQLFPLLYFFWKKFHEDWLKNTTAKEVLIKIETQMKPRRASTPHKDMEVPDFLQLGYSHCNISQQVMLDDDHFRISFSLVSGMKLIYPIPKGQKTQEKTSASNVQDSKKATKASQMSIGNVREGHKDEKGSKNKLKRHSLLGRRMSNVMGGDQSKGGGAIQNRPIITPQQEKARRLSHLVEELNNQQQHIKNRKTGKFKSFDQVVIAALKDLREKKSPRFE